MANFKERIQSALGKVRREAKHTLATPEHREASRLLEKGRKKYNAKDYLTARQFFQKAVDTDHEYAMAYYYLGLAKHKLNEPREALKCWERAILLDPGSKAAIKADEKLESNKKKIAKSVGQLENRLHGR